MILVLLGCILRSPQLIGVDVQSVEVYDVNTHNVKMIIGMTTGTATLRITDTEGQVHSVPVRTGGASLGAGLAFTESTSTARRATTATLDTPPGASANTCFGWYTGTSWDGAMAMGWRSRDLTRSDCVWTESGPTYGLGSFYGVETMWLRPERKFTRNNEEVQP